MFSSKDIFLGKGGAGGYQISRSVRLRSSASAYFTRTPASASNQRTWSWSAWVKRGLLGSEQMLFEGGIYSGSTEQLRLFFTSSDNLEFNEFSSSAYQFRYVTTQVFRDPSAWYHILAVLDTTNSVGKLYVNGTQITSFSTSTAPALNFQGKVNSVVAHDIGRRNGLSAYLDGYLTEINFIDGQALTPSSFGATNTTTGVWGPAKYTGTYGTNGFYLNFSDNSNNTATTIGKDYSGNGNNWTPNNISVTSGVTYDSMTDVPTLTSTTAANYCVWNPNFRFSYSGGFAGTFSNGNLQVATGGNPSQFAGSMALPDGAYFEVTPSSIDAVRTYVGLFAVSRSNLVTSTTNNAYNGTYNVLYSSNGEIYVNTTSGSNLFGTFSSYTNGDVISVAYKSGKIYFAKNNVWQNSGVPASGTGYVATGWDAYGDLLPYCGFNSTFTGNFGQQPFTYTPPTGFIGVCSNNLSTPTIANGAAYMAATTYDGNGSSQSLTNTVNSVSFQPDFVWVKKRSGATNHYLWDSVRGVLKEMYSNLTNAESTNTIGLSAFNSNGFTLNNGDSAWNASGSTYVGWNWKAGGSSSSNTSGSITSTVSVNATAGFSVVTYTGSGSSATVGHGLGVAPSMIIIKNRGSAQSWRVYHTSVGVNAYLLLDSTAGSASDSGWTATSSTTFTVGGSGAQYNASSNTYVAYCFAPIAGYSAFGLYTGNGSTDGTFVYTGFRPRFILYKPTIVGATDWVMWDTVRSTYNVQGNYLLANTAGAEGSATVIDILSNGFKLRTNTTGNNGSGDTIVYACFAENPFKYSLAR
jgi:hypothetical protein